MKRLLFFCAFALCIAACDKGGDAVLPDAPGEPSAPGIPDLPAVTTAPVTRYEATTAVLGGFVTGADAATLECVGVQYLPWADGEEPAETAWTQSAEVLASAPAEEWTLTVGGLQPATRYAVRAFAAVGGVRTCGGVRTFTTREQADPDPEPDPEPDPVLDVAALRTLHAVSADVSQRRVCGIVALSVAAEEATEDFPEGMLILYDNEGAPASALCLTGEGVAAAAAQRGDRLEIDLLGAERTLAEGMIPGYAVASRERVRKLDGGHAIVPVWASPARLTASPADFAALPVQIDRVYAQTPGMPFWSEGLRFSDGETSLSVRAARGSEAGACAPNGAMGSLRGVCWWDGALLIAPFTADDVADFTGDEGWTEGEPSIEILHTEYCEFPPQGGERTVECRVTAPQGMRLWADLRNVDAERFSVAIAGDRVRIAARPDVSGRTLDYVNCYLYLAETRDGRRYAPQTIRIAQIAGRYESLPALIAANGGELASVHEAVVNGVPTRAMKLGSGSYSGHYLSDPTGASGDRRLTFHAVGWREGGHDAATLYLRAVGGGELSVESIPLKINDGATGMAPFTLTVGDDSRYEVLLRGWTPGSAVEFSTSPAFDKRKDDKRGRALLFGLQID